MSAAAIGDQQKKQRSFKILSANNRNYFFYSQWSLFFWRICWSGFIIQVADVLIVMMLIAHSVLRRVLKLLKIPVYISGMDSRVAIHQATYRTMLGANPIKTGHLLKASLHQNDYLNAGTFCMPHQKQLNPTTTATSHQLQSRSDKKRQLLTEAAHNHELSSPGTTSDGVNTVY